MSYNYLIESSAWVEYLGGSDRGKKISSIIETETIATSIISIAELADKAEREQQSLGIILQFIQSKAAILPITVNVALRAAQLKKKLREQHPKFGLVDGIHLATSVEHHTILVTADHDFRGVENTIII